MQRISATEMIILICKFNIKNTLITRKNIVEHQQNRKMI